MWPFGDKYKATDLNPFREDVGGDDLSDIEDIENFIYEISIYEKINEVDSDKNGMIDDYEAGVYDGRNGKPPIPNASDDYKVGYEDGVGDATLEDEIRAQDRFRS